MTTTASNQTQANHPAQPAGASQELTPKRIFQMAWGYTGPLLIESAVHHRVFDILDAGPLQAEQLASRTNTSPRGMRMLLNALVGLEFLKRDASGRYSLTPESATFLVSTKPGFQGGIFRHISSQLMPVWMDLSDIVRTGKPVRSVNQHEESAFFEKFVEDIFPMSYGAAKALGQSLNLNGKPIKVLDIAAGSGVWGIAIAQQAPQAKITAVDWENVLAVTRRIAQKHNVADRFNFVAGDINSVDLGKGYDLATLGHILHSEGEARSRTLLKRIFEALAPGGTIAIQEFVCDDDRTGPAMPLIFAVNMLVNTDQGDTFTFSEMKGWLKEAGFVDARTLEAPGPSPILLANRPK